jgi:hypothetical protein
MAQPHLLVVARLRLEGLEALLQVRGVHSVVGLALFHPFEFFGAALVLHGHALCQLALQFGNFRNFLEE